ncbi:Lipase (class 3) [Ceratobasidium sp. AG-Ba]|nr:Lipase (class 3) [Ceratobasidium sp. AG-Ba]
MFPGAPMTALVHAGFKSAHARTASTILSTVNQIIAERNATNVICVGHSLGGALAILEGLYMRLNLPANINVVTRTFGQPRIGNAALADFIDATLPDLARVTIKRDLVPTLPPLTTLYAHSKGEIHLNQDNVYEACSGHDNPSVNCSTGQVLAQGFELEDHVGPYPGGITLGTPDQGTLC